MRSLCLALFIFFTSLKLSAQEVTVSGKIVNEKGQPVSFATVYVRNTTKGASANSDGEYSLSLKPGQYDIRFKAVGYKQESRQVTLKDNQIINVTLKDELYQLKEVAVRSGAEDPAYSIIRHAIKKRKTYLNEVNAYTCEVYIKGLQKLLAAPKKFLGVDIQKIARENGLDSNRRGIIYLSESQSKLAFSKPNHVHEELISSKVSGSNQAFSFNRASDVRVNFYENLQTWEGLSLRPLISPIADNALSYYKYKWMGISIENGETVNKILVTPRHELDPCFSGYLYIMDDSWRLQSLSLYLTKKANINFVDTLKVNQEFVPVNSKVWMPASIKFEFTGGIFTFKFAGYFISVYKDYEIDPVLDKKQFAEVLRVTYGSNKKDSAYWNRERPIPLTAEEKTDYKNKAVLAAKRESKSYLDSLDAINNQLTPAKILYKGYRHRNRFDQEYYNFSPLATSVIFNTVEGFALDYKASYIKKIDTLNNRYLALNGKVHYGFSNHLLSGSGGITFPAGPFTLNFAGGSDVVDINPVSSIRPLTNSLTTLLLRKNYQKLYQKKFASFTASTRITGGWLATATTEWANRKWLPNTSDFSIFHPKGREYTSNNPYLPSQDVPLFPENQSFKIKLRTTYDFSNRYESFPTGKRYLPSDYPTVGLTFTKAFRAVLGSDDSYSLISADVSKYDILVGIYGKTSFAVSAGKFINSKPAFYTDYQHFAGNIGVLYTPGLLNFQLLDYYIFSSSNKFLEAHLEHNFSGYLTGNIPFIRKFKLQEIIDVNYLSTPLLKNYTEFAFGLEFPGRIRIMYAASVNSGRNTEKQGIRLGISF